MKDKTFLKSAKCPVCPCIIVVRRYSNLPASLLKSLALADHFRTLHVPQIRREVSS